MLSRQSLALGLVAGLPMLHLAFPPAVHGSAAAADFQELAHGCSPRFYGDVSCGTAAVAAYL